MQLETPAHQNSSARSIWLISQFELTRLFLTKRGMILLAAFAIVWFFIFKVLILESVEMLNDPNTLNIASSFLGQLNLNYLLQWPYSELAAYWLIAIFIFPYITILMTSDQTASDAKRGTIRFLLLRTSRNELLFGRFIGQFIITVSLISLTIIPTLIMGMIREPNNALATVPQLISVYGNLILLCSPFIAFMALLNSAYQSSKISMLLAIILVPLISSIIGGLSNYLSILEFLLYAIPGVQLTDTVQLTNFKLSSIIIPLFQTVAYLTLAQFVLARKSL